MRRSGRSSSTSRRDARGTRLRHRRAAFASSLAHPANASAIVTERRTATPVPPLPAERPSSAAGAPNDGREGAEVRRYSRTAKPNAFHGAPEAGGRLRVGAVALRVVLPPRSPRPPSRRRTRSGSGPLHRVPRGRRAWPDTRSLSAPMLLHASPPAGARVLANASHKLRALSVQARDTAGYQVLPRQRYGSHPSARPLHAVVRHRCA